MNALPFLLLIAALLLFLLSTRQYRLRLRGAIWLGGAVLLAVSALGAGRDGGGGLFLAIQDAATSAAFLSDSVVWQALWGNRDTVGGSIVPMLDVFLVLGALLGLLALIAFTPGDKVERFTRPLCIALLGAIGGGVFALAVVAIGFGDYSKRRVYIDTVEAEDVIDGDTFKMGDVAMRLDGIDAPEASQICFRDGRPRPCGEEAREALVELTAGGAIVVCGRRGEDPESRAVRVPRETYGRPLVQCWIRRGEEQFDLARQMVRAGHAVEWRARISGPYSDDIAFARAEGEGLWSTCTLSPSVWRNPTQAEAVEAFRANGAPPPQVPTIGACVEADASSDNPR
jgi:endonuclease YncB( thermonuclease family)